MKLVTKNTDVNYLHGLKGLLEANGIPAVVQGENTARMMPPLSVFEPGLWVYLDDQAEEAIRLVNDPDYEVQGKIDVEAFYNQVADQQENPRALNRALIQIGLIAVGIVVGLYLLIQLLEGLSR